jgi:hypothetical protein
MPIYNFTVTHANQTTTTASKVIDAPGNGQSVNIPNVPCACGFNHTLVGTQANNSNSMSGAGFGSVAPPNDPIGGKPPGLKTPAGDEEPKWEGSPGSPEPKSQVKKTPSTKAPGKKAPGKKQPSKKTPSKTPSKKAPSKKAPSKKAPSKKAPSKKAPSKKAPSKKAPSKKTPSKKTPSKKKSK